MRNNTRQEVINDMPDARAKRIGQQTELRLLNDNNYMELVKQSDKLNNEIIRYNSLLDSTEGKMTELEQEAQQLSANIEYILSVQYITSNSICDK